MRRSWAVVAIALWALVALGGCTARSAATWCDHEYLDLRDSPSHCGACGNACPHGASCIDGRCACSAVRLSNCGPACFDLTTNDDHCGACGHACRASEHCAAGACVCPFGDLATNPDHCGACDNPCLRGQVCNDGRCECPVGRVSICSTGCTDLASDETNCGACNRACSQGHSCRGGQCLCLRDDLMTNPAHCGACGHRCGSEMFCRDGVCVCTAERLTACAGVCVDLMTDPRACGACGRSCTGEAMSCVEGRCVCTGTMGMVCYGRCVDVATNVLQCGACGHVCEPGDMCERGVCLPRPLAPSSGARIANGLPTFRWSTTALASPRVEVCADRACVRIVQTVEATGPSATPSSPLAAGVYFWRITDRAAGVHGPTWEFAVGPRASVAGAVIGSLRDLDGDGLSDLIVGAPEGRAVLFYAGRAGAAPTLLLRVHNNASLGFGSHVAFAGDHDGDGFEDATASGNVGAIGTLAWLYRGGATGPTPVAGGDPSRVAARGVGDLDGDGRADLAVGVPNASQVHFFRVFPAGATPFPAVTREPGSLFGAAVAPAWDVDGDGLTDLLIGAPGSDGGRGAAYLYRGAAAGLADPRVLPRPADAMAFGVEVAGLGDVNGDGLADMLVGASGSRAFVYLSGAAPDALPTVLTAPGASEAHAVAAGDVDGDGFDDVLLPLPALGRADLYRGGVGGLSVTPVALTDAVWTRATGVVVGAGDLDGDGCSDVAIGVPAADTVRVLYGDPLRPLARQVVLMGTAGEGFGTSID